jgi:hypothetical protein
MVETRDVGILLVAGEVERGRLARTPCDEASTAPDAASAPTIPLRLVIMVSSLCPRDSATLNGQGYLLTGLSGLISSATTSLICSIVSTLLVPNRGMFEHGIVACEL